MPSVRSVLSQRNTRFSLLHLLYDKLSSNITWIFDQPERAQAVIYIINLHK